MVFGGSDFDTAAHNFVGFHVWWIQPKFGQANAIMLAHVQVSAHMALWC